MSKISNQIPPYAELHCLSNFSFLRGASHAEELVETAAQLGYKALAITDECSMAGIVRAWGKAKEIDFHLIIGSEFTLSDGFRLIALARNFDGYSQLCALISQARHKAEKGCYQITFEMIVSAGLNDCEIVLVPPLFPVDHAHTYQIFRWFTEHFAKGWLALELHFSQLDRKHLGWLRQISKTYALPLLACGDVHMHERHRQALQDVITCIRLGCTLAESGRRLFPNAERHLRSREELSIIYPPDSLHNTIEISNRCQFKLSELHYEYPSELVAKGYSASRWLRQLTEKGKQWRWPEGTSTSVHKQIEKELHLIHELNYEHYFLTVHDIVCFARKQNILCQGRGSAANSAVCYCLGITEVNPARMNMLFERFISKERNEPPDIDVDFEHERREEVIQYIYKRYGRDRAALAATVIRYRRRSAIRELGKVLGFQSEQIDALNKSLAWWDDSSMVIERFEEMGFSNDSRLITQFRTLLVQLIGFPRHLSQHVGGFVISHHPLHSLVPVENAAMENRTIIQWDKDDLEELGLLKVDVLALGMLTAIRKCLTLLSKGQTHPLTLADIPTGDKATYAMICKADTLGVFQIESRAQMSMLPRLRPQNFYDLVIEVAIVRPGPIQGGMVNPYLKRRQGIESVTYPSKELQQVLQRTLGVPVFQEQVMEIAMVAAGFTAGQADGLRRSMAAWRRVGSVSRFRDKLIGGMKNNGYEDEFADAVFKQIEGFGEYGFPESHAASFALLVYVSAWLKCHYPAAFLCGMLNSQPLGFYSPSDLVRDARKHKVKVLAIDINQSTWDHQLIDDDDPEPSVRLGFRLIKGLSRKGVDRLLDQRKYGPFINPENLLQRCNINRHDQQALAHAGTLTCLSKDRHSVQWDLLGVEKLPGLLNNASPEEPAIDLPKTTEAQDISADYNTTGLTLRRHPLTLLRHNLTRRGLITAKDWRKIPNGRVVQLAGLVRVRQRPLTASGVLFMTLEDETDTMNIIIWQKVTEKYRREILSSQLLAIKGVTQRADNVVHLVAKEVFDLSWMLGKLEIPARNFH